MQVSALNPASPEARHILSLWNVCMWICGAILAIVILSIVYILVRYHHGVGDPEPPQITGSRKLEIIWTAVPIGIVTLLFVLSLMATGAVFDHPPQKPDIVVTGHQWWWEIYYPADNVYTANEVHIPTGRDMMIGVEAADVIHDFWTPRLGPKVDAIPGRRNITWIRADQPGTYRGFCAEFCGTEHAWMLFRVVAQQPADYEAWLGAQSRPAMQPTAGDAELGAVRFRELTCANCHNIRGSSAQQQYAPDLTHLASRAMLAGERLKNTPENLRDWLHEPNILKPGCQMPNLQLSPDDLTRLTAYLESLK